VHLSSTAVLATRLLPARYAYRGVTGGENKSLPLSWEEAPEGTRSFALSMIDTHPVAHHWVHWIVINIPAQTRHLAENASGRAMPAGAKECYNSFGTPGYGGPQPPKGSGPHHYLTTLYALDLPTIDLSANAGLDALTQATAGHILATASVTADYERV
jgi:Raf kinase inhibitor-like YbhB/YbcL family protein